MNIMRTFCNKYSPEKIILIIVFSFSFCKIFAQNVTVKSPDQKKAFSIYNSYDTEDELRKLFLISILV